MLEMYHYEETLLRSTLKLAQEDHHYQILQKQRLARRGYSVHNTQCDLCGAHLVTQTGKAIVFRCK